jgi:branched-chain amino acid aminotransferase
MSIYVSLNGKISSAQEASISVLDRGFLYGDSVYEVLRTYAGKPFALREHLERLRKSADEIFLSITKSDEAFASELSALLASVPYVGESYIRIVVTRGASDDIALDPALAKEPTYLLLVKPFPHIPPELYTEGARVVFVRHPTNPLRGVKTGNYLANILALREAKKKSAYEGWLVDEGEILSEGANSNLFLIKDDIVRTPPLSAGLLAGITRQKVLEICAREKIAHREESLTVQDALSCDEAFLTSTLREVMPVTRIEEYLPIQGRERPLTRRLRELFHQAARGC